jgi:arylsulfatase A-like enzyme
VRLQEIARAGLVRVEGIARASLAVLAALVPACRPAPPPNLVLITLDTTRADRLGPYGHADAQTPALDAFARESVVYENAYATSSWTLPSHASLFTGLLPMQHGAQTAAGGPSALLGYGVRGLAEEFTTLAEALRDAGYRTGAVVGGPALRRELGLAQGFERYLDDLDGPLDKLIGKRANVIANRSIALLERFGAQPFFLFANFYDPHAPYRPPDAGELPEPDHAPVVAEMLSQLAVGDRAGSGRLRPEENPELAAMLQGYDAEIRFMDRHLGRLLEALRRSPRWSETLVAVTSDHGESFGEHFYISHGAHLYEDNVRVPLIVRFPNGAGAGTRVGEPVGNRALFATLLGAAGLAVDPGLPDLEDRGAPIVTELRRSDNNVRLLGPHFDRDLLALYAPPWKLIRDSRGPVELFRIDADPGEVRNLAPGDPGAVAELSGQLEGIEELHPPLFDRDARAELSEDTENALRALGYLP